MNLLQIIHDNPATSAFTATMAVAVEAINSPAGWESLTLKGVLIAAVVYLVRELGAQRDINKAEASKREEILIAALKTYQDAAIEHSAALQELKSAAETQTGYFKTVAQTLLSRDYHPKLPE